MDGTQIDAEIERMRIELKPMLDQCEHEVYNTKMANGEVCLGGKTYKTDEYKEAEGNFEYVLKGKRLCESVTDTVLANIIHDFFYITSWGDTFGAKFLLYKVSNLDLSPKLAVAFLMVCERLPRMLCDSCDCYTMDALEPASKALIEKAKVKLKAEEKQQGANPLAKDGEKLEAPATFSRRPVPSAPTTAAPKLKR